MSSAATQRPRILVVDDEERNCQLMRRIFADRYDVITACDADSAMALARDSRFDAALVDFRMPGKDGTEVLAYLAEVQSECVRFLVTAYTEPQVYQLAINRGQVYRFLQKPCDPVQLRLDVQRALEHGQSIRNAQLHARLAAVGKLAGSVIHDLRNSLGSLAMVPALLELNDTASQALCKEMLQRATHHMTSLVEEMTSLARGNERQLVKSMTPLQSVIKRAVDVSLATPQFQQRSIIQQFDDTLPPLNIDPDACERMVVNLLRNALEATQPDQEVGVRLERQGNDIVCAVWDKGTGIPSEVLTQLFTPLFTTKGDNGTGLGLWGAQNAMQAHGGKLEAQTDLGRGTTFLARFPLRAVT